LTITADQYVNLAAKLYTAQRYEEALRACNQAIELDPQCARAYHGRGLALFKVGRYHEVLKEYEISLGLDPENPKLDADMKYLLNFLHSMKVQDLLSQAEHLHTVSEFDLSIAVYRKVLELEPGNQKAINGIKKVEDEKLQIELGRHPRWCRCNDCIDASR
jgi:tetratricopeptide (TPR) repeat protein